MSSSPITTPSPSGPRSTLDSTEPVLHPHLRSQLAEMTLGADGVPDRESWERFLADVNRRYLSHREGDNDHTLGWSSFENLFQMSPIPTMEQDYTALESWMDVLKARGITDLRDYLGDNIDLIRRIAPMVRIVAANPAAALAVGLPEHKLIGPIDPSIINDESLVGWLSQLDAVWNGIPTAEASFVAATPDGRTYDAHSNLSAPVIDGRPDFSRALFTLRDVTNHRNEERRMLALIEAKDTFLASVSHEIRTPLTAVLGFAELLEDDIDNFKDDDRRLMATSIATHARDVAHLVEDLLVAARVDAASVEVAVRPFNVAHQVRSTIEAGGSFTLDVQIDWPDEPIRALGDPGRFRQILRNLLTNAERYGGPNVSIRLTADESHVYLAVIDDGPGLPPAQWELIFEPYRTAHQTPGLPGSVGIGLTVSRQLSSLMGATLDYYCGADGSMFTLGLKRDLACIAKIHGSG